MITDAAKAVIECNDYLPFGDELPATTQNGRGGIACYSGETGLRQKFTGKERDTESRLDYFGARYYSWAGGRFTSPDEPFVDQQAIDPQSWNLYAYVRNNPLRNIDTDGRSCLDGLSNCANYFIGGLKAVGNIPADVLNLPTTLTDWAISPFTEFRFGNFVERPYEATNFDQQEGMAAANATMLVTPLIELGASRAAGTVEVFTPTGGHLGNSTTRAQVGAIAENLEGRGFTIKAGGGKFKEEYIPGPGGARKGSSYVDITAERNGRRLRVQTVDTKADQITPTTREAKAAQRIRSHQKPRDHTVLIRKKKPNEE